MKLPQIKNFSYSSLLPVGILLVALLPIVNASTNLSTDLPLFTSGAASTSQQACEEKKKADYRGKSFKKGEVVVTFKEATFAQAEEFAKQNDLKTRAVEPKGSAEQSYEKSKSIIYVVKNGKEVTWLCNLEKNPNIKSVELASSADAN